ncbi:MAG: hypothetical protein ABI882_02250 [Acidobacteriota bacterium]
MLLSGEVMRGHQVASRASEHYDRGALELQMPFFKERGLDLSGYYSATLNISIAPLTFRMINAELHFSRVAWTSKHPPEDFSFSRCRVHFKETSHDGWIYYPHPETKVRHHQNASLIEVIAPFIAGLGYGSKVGLEVNKSEVEVSGEATSKEVV